ncbi:hypothetical protein SCLCIDRAFT_1212152 [Scleroderma citrinum Foug A]|uniref:AIG1-type G domain-containing protein n=1 Tax=Scleroderma citrinum Foug A TaxID=1036808 RepID=A0A0C3EAP8_9AGAM|nr:hypothetical protein SCLCIDRAFT_1212152 [Scleroderma citrinum Foug A]
MIATFLKEECQGQTLELVGLIYVHRISDTRMGATAKRNLRMFRKLCGLRSMGNVVIVTTMWDKVTPEEGSQREMELAHSQDLFKPLLTAGAKMARYENRKSALRVLDYLLRKNITTLQIVRELVEEKKILVDTAAGKELQGDIRDFMRRRMKEIQDLEEEIRVATELKDRRTVNEIMGERRNLEEEWGKLRAELGKLGHSLGKSFAQHVLTFVIFMTSLLELSKRNTSLSDLEWRL